jgi:site-specific DNA-adenine methylase
MRLKPFFPYFGSKWKLAPKYPEPLHETIVEPFAGSACYSLFYPEKKIVLNDLNPFIVGIWRYLIDTPEDEILRLPLLKSGQDLRELDIPQGAQWLIGIWIFSGIPHMRYVTYKSQESINARAAKSMTWGDPVKRRIVEQQECIRHWKVSETDYRDLSQETVTWFVDPPYQVAGKGYKFQPDFRSMGDWCRSLPGQVIVCEQEGADWMDFRPFREIQGGAGIYRKSVSKQEMIWTKES